MSTTALNFQPLSPRGEVTDNIKLMVQQNSTSLALINCLFLFPVFLDISNFVIRVAENLNTQNLLIILFICQLALILGLNFIYKKLSSGNQMQKEYSIFIIIATFVAIDFCKETLKKDENLEGVFQNTSFGSYTSKLVVYVIQVSLLRIPNFIKLLPIAFYGFGVSGLVWLANFGKYACIEGSLITILLCFLPFTFQRRDRKMNVNSIKYEIESQMKEILLSNVEEGAAIFDSELNALVTNKALMQKYDFEASRNVNEFLNQFKNLTFSRELKFLSDTLKTANPRIVGLEDRFSFKEFIQWLFLNFDDIENTQLILTEDGEELKPQIFTISSRNGLTLTNIRLSLFEKDKTKCIFLIFSVQIIPTYNIESRGDDNSMRQQFLASVSHELRTPLNSSLTLIQSCLQNSTLPVQIKDTLLRPAFHSLQLLLHIINDLLDYSNLTNGQFKTAFEMVKIDQIINKAIKLVEIQAQKKNLYIHSHFDEHLTEEIFTDPDRVTQILLNLLSNAIKYTIKGGIVVSANYLPSSSLITISVRDTGIGLNEEDLSRLQRNLQKLEEGTRLNQHSSGIGIGLTISNFIAAILGRGPQDYIRVVSKGKGCEFSFFIEDKSRNQRVNSDETDIVDGSRKKILTLKTFAHKKTLAIGQYESELVKETDRSLSEYLKKEEDITEDYGQLSPTFISNIHSFSQRGKTEYEVKKSVTRNIKSLKHAESGYNDVAKSMIPQRFVPKHALIVDDDSLNILSLEIILKGLGITHEHAYNGKEAIEKACENEYDLILMDCNMPIMDGWEATKKIKQMIAEGDLKDVIIIACTAYEDSESLQKCIDSGMTAIVNKPVNKEKLRKAFENITTNDLY